MIRLLLRGKEGFEGLCCVCGYVCHRWLERCRILSLVSEPGVNDLFRLNEFPLFSWRKFSLIHFLVLSALMFTAMPSIALGATNLEPYETVVSEVTGVPKENAIVMAWGATEAQSHFDVSALQFDGNPRFEQLVDHTYLKTPSGPWVTDLGEAYILAAKAEWSALGGGGGGHAIGGDDGGGGGAGHSFDPPEPANVFSNDVEMTPFAASTSYYPAEGSTVTSSERITVYKLGTTDYYPALRGGNVAQKFKVHIPDDVVSAVASYFADNPNGVCLMHMDNRSNTFRVNVECLADDRLIYINARDGLGVAYILYNYSAGDAVYARSASKGVSSWPDSVDALKDSAFNFTSWGRPYTTPRSSDGQGSVNNYQTAYAVFHAKDGYIVPYDPNGGGDDNPSGGDDPSGGSDDEPSGGDDEPSAPTPPEIDPTEYTTYEGDNTDITVNVTFNHDGGQTDLTPITTRLDRIYARLGDIGRDLLNFDQHVQTSFYNLENKLDGLFSSYLGSVKTWLEMIYARLNDINRNIGNLDKSTDDLADLSVIEHQLRDLVDSDGVTLTVHGLLYWINYYLQDIDRFLHDWNPYEPIDYSTVLNNIYDEISDFTNSFSQFWTDLNGKLNTIITDLENLKFAPRYPTNPYPRPPSNPETGIVPWEDMLNVNALRDAITRMMQKFPFATINNFVLILTMLVRPAQAPQFDLPLPNPSDWSDPYMVHVDLSIWDVPAAVLRTGTMLWAIARVSRRTVALWTSEEGGGEGV